mmetsp:Transcript_62297/g.163580  ORF Transcript_62297/g.163580 Transcript_62297/m.163580 type:complete len:227 (+) Transcript_62297:1544-2224(+)
MGTSKLSSQTASRRLTTGSGANLAEEVASVISTISSSSSGRALEDDDFGVMAEMDGERGTASDGVVARSEPASGHAGALGDGVDDPVGALGDGEADPIGALGDGMSRVEALSALVVSRRIGDAGGGVASGGGGAAVAKVSLGQTGTSFAWAGSSSGARRPAAACAAAGTCAAAGASSSSVPKHSLTVDFFFLNSHISAAAGRVCNPGRQGGAAYEGRAASFRPLSA